MRFFILPILVLLMFQSVLTAQERITEPTGENEEDNSSVLCGGVERWSMNLG